MSINKIIATLLGLAVVALILVLIFVRVDKTLESPDEEIPTLEETEAKPEVRTTSLLVYFGSSTLDPETLHCEITYPAVRIVTVEPGMGKLALSELLKGPTVAEKAQGFTTTIESTVSLNSLAVVDGVAHADFSGLTGGGSCRVAAITSQIKNTLLQFPTVTDVVITVDGVPGEEVLQP